MIIWENVFSINFVPLQNEKFTVPSVAGLKVRRDACSFSKDGLQLRNLAQVAFKDFVKNVYAGWKFYSGTWHIPGGAFSLCLQPLRRGCRQCMHLAHRLGISPRRCALAFSKIFVYRERFFWSYLFFFQNILLIISAELKFPPHIRIVAAQIACFKFFYKFCVWEKNSPFCYIEKFGLFL